MLFSKNAEMKELTYATASWLVYVELFIICIVPAIYRVSLTLHKAVELGMLAGDTV
jgi:hypothetical protein